MKDIPADQLPPEVEKAARRLMELFMQQGGKIATEQELKAAGEELIVQVGSFEEDDYEDVDEDEIDEFLEDLADEDAQEREALVARGITVQPKLPKIFRLIIENHNARLEIHAKGDKMRQDEWRQLKELYRDMRESLRPGAERALSKGPA